MVKKSGLGRGLTALIPIGKETDHPDDHYEELAVDLLDPNPEQPRQQFHEERLLELADSIRHHGVIQPIIVTPRENRYIVIAGERRWRATKLAGYEKIPAVVRQVDPGKMLSLALLENIQRQELNPIEEALAYQRLLETHGFTHETLASNLGKGRVTITNTLRLLRLPDTVKNMIQDGQLTFGHARCLVTVDQSERQKKLAETSVERQWSVRELERRIQQERNDSPKKPVPKDVALGEMEKQLYARFQSKVTIAGTGKKGKITFSYGSEMELNRIFTSMMR